jgi:ribonuclease T2
MWALLLALFALLGASAAFAQAPGRFDYYVLSLNWSPTYCANPSNARRDPGQCGVRRGLVVHGLWPQNERGWPESCPSAQPPNVPNALKRQYLDMFPSAGLIEHEWDKHGVCSGLTQKQYLDQTRALRAKLRIPASLAPPTRPVTTSAAAIRVALTRANPTLKGDAFVLRCRAGQLDEVRVCFTKAGAPRRCGADVKGNCPGGKLTLPAN